jgi:non-specific serine/threonine protein kinase/serine/threonine-protein kinase
VTEPRYERVRRLFKGAVELNPDEVPQFLENACGNDKDLYREVSRLLEADIELELASSPPPAPVRIGHFRLIRPLGEGGMGEVWEAEQTSPVRRLAAVKLIKWGMDTREVLARFEAERQALAWMNHTNIAAVFEAGSTPEGRPFFAMEYVEGVDIATYCDHNRLTIQDRLELFVDVCNGVQHAHQKGIIHRDLKPSNVLVTEIDGVAVPKIIDFGVAKAIDVPLTDHTLETSLGHFIGTPEYMSPEQAGRGCGDVDTRSDVFSLGVLLCELLVGTPPFVDLDHRNVALDEVWRQVREGEPKRPSTLITRQSGESQEYAERRGTDVAGLRRAVRGDLDWIVLRALEKDRSRRYSSVADLGEDVVRHLRHEPVSAGPPGVMYRFGKLVRRHRVVSIASVLVMLSMVAAVVGTAHGLLRAREEAATARAASNLLESVVLEMNPRSRTAYAASPREIVDRMVERIDLDLGDQPLEVARMLTALGVTYEGFGEFDLARSLLKRSADIRLETLGRDHLDYAESLSHLGNLMSDIGDDEAARRLHAESLEIRERLCEPDVPVLVSSLERLMIAAYYAGDCESALTLGRRILDAVGSSDIAGRPELETAVVTTGTSAALCEDLDLARAMLDRSSEVEGRFAGPENLGKARSLLNYAGFLDLMGQHREALPHAIHGLEIWNRLDGPHDRAYAVCLANVASILFHLERLEAAESMYNQMFALVEELGSPMPDLELSMYESALVLAGLGKTEGAVNRLAEAIIQGLDEPTLFDNPALDGLRGNPRFEELAGRVRRRVGPSLMH